MVATSELWESHEELDGVEVPLYFKKIGNLKSVAVTKGGKWGSSYQSDFIFILLFRK